MLQVDLALRSWRDRQGEFPPQLEYLVPSLLPRLPLDPFTNRSLIYHPTGRNEFLLYSTGPKGLDGGGRFGHWLAVSAGEADLCLDADDFPRHDSDEWE
jgi:hypothetical protein